MRERVNLLYDWVALCLDLDIKNGGGWDMLCPYV